MSLFDAQFLNRCEQLSLVCRTQFGGRLLGQRPGRQLAGGTEVTGYSDYTAGSDIRYVDWNRCARHDELLVKQFYGDEDLHTYLLVDCSASMGLGGKFDYARQLAGAMAYVALANLNRVSLVAFGGEILQSLPPRRGSGHIVEMLRLLDSLQPSAGDTNLAHLAEALVRRHQRPGFAVVLSDLYDPRGFERGLDVLRRRQYELHVVQLLDESETRFDQLGDVELVHLEPAGSQHVRIDGAVLKRYRQRFGDFCRQVRRWSHDHGFGCTQTTCTRAYDRQLLRMMHAAGRAAA